jgi:hypothetical protein
MSKTPNLAAALADAGGSTRRRPIPVQNPPHTAIHGAVQGGQYRQPGRAGTRPITVHFPEEVRDQLKLLALQQKKTLHNLLAEGFNDLFAKYGRPEIAPTERGEV